MTIYDDITQREKVDVEFKLIPNENRIKYLKTAVAFANGKGGRLLFGVDNEGVIQGIANDKVYAEMDSITNSIVDACYPRLPFDAGIENINDKAIIVLDILPGSRPPYFIKSEGEKEGVYVRIGATTQRADDATRRELMFLSEGRSFDTEPCPKAKIDEKRIRSLCSKMYRMARLNCDTEVERKQVKRISLEQLKAWNIVSNVHGTWVGSNAYALLTGDPAFAIRLKCGLFRGNDKTIFLDRRDFVGSVPQLIEQGLEYILAKINRGCYFRGAFRHDRYELPPDALRELVINAFAHRSYLQHDAPIFIAIYDTRVEITSPGGLPREQTPERALAGYSKIRNSALARALNYMRFMEEWGSGLRRANNVLNEYGLQPVPLVDTGFAVSINIYRPTYGEPVKPAGEPVSEPVKPTGEPVNTAGEPVSEPVKPAGEPVVSEPVKPAGEPVNQKGEPVKPTDEPVSEPVNQKDEPVNTGNPLETTIYQAIATKPGISIAALTLKTGRSRATIKRTLAQLRMKRRIVFQGSPKFGGYYATSSLE